MATMADNLIDFPGDPDEDQRLLDIQALMEAEGPEILTEDEAAEYQAAFGATNRSVPGSHYENLAERLNANVLDRLATDVIEWTERDEASRAEWYARERRGMELMGLIDDSTWVAPFEGATTVVHPMFAEATTNFQARAIAELWPAGGPVKTRVMGLPTREREQQAERVQSYMNWHYENIDGFDEQDRLLMRLPMSGSCFKKHYFDPVRDEVRSDYIEAADVLVPYQATSLEASPRYTHRMRESGNDIRKMVATGWYRDVGEDYTQPLDAGQDLTEVHDAIDEAEGRALIEYEEDGTYRLLETVCNLNLEGFEDLGPDGKPTGIALPYVVTVDADNQTVLAIRRAWRKGDPLKERRVLMTHYKFLPGLGFYGYGYVHILGGLFRSATGALRSFLDSAGFANMQGGFRSRDAKLKDNVKVGMGEWVEVDMTAEELSKAMMPLNYKEPSRALFEMLGYLDELGRRYASTTENMVGEANNNGPVGTTLALIEQGMKVFSSIHKRLHNAQGHEFKVMADLHAEYGPEQYPYLTEGQEQVILRTDFDERVDVIPVSDPNIITNTQRIAQGQALVQLATENPDLYDRYETHKTMLEALRIPNVDTYLPPPQETPQRDPIGEGVAMSRGEPVQAFVEQDHYAHMLAHRLWWEVAVLDDLREDLEPAYKAHMAEHMAFFYQVQMAAQTGYSEQFAQDPTMQQAMAEQAALVTNLLAPPPMALNQEVEEPKADPALEQQAEIARKDQAALADIDRKDAMAFAQIERDNAKADAEIERSAMRDLQRSAEQEAQALAKLKDIERSK